MSNFEDIAKRSVSSYQVVRRRWRTPVFFLRLFKKIMGLTTKTLSVALAGVNKQGFKFCLYNAKDTA